MLNRHLLTSTVVLRSVASVGRTAATRSLSHIASPAVPVRTSTSALRVSNGLPQARLNSLRRISQSSQARDGAEAVASASNDSGITQSEDPNAYDSVLPEGNPLKRTKGELKTRAPKHGTFASLKGSIENGMWKALTVAPFGYTDMSAVQQSVLHLLPALASSIGAEAEPMPDGLGRDMLVKARTGTGKTIAFLVPALEARFRSLVDVRRGIFTKPWQDMLSRHKTDFDYEKLDEHDRDNLTTQFANNTVGVLVLSPTRELATQIAEEANKLLSHDPSMCVQLLVGGTNRSRQIDDWRRSKSRPDVVVATPGRLLDLLNDVGMIREAMTACRTLVLDEADTLLEMGFRDDLQAIMKHLPAKVDRQNMLFSATVSQEIQAIARASLDKDYRFIDCVPAGEENVHKHIPQYATVLESAAEQIPHILRLIAHDQLTNVGKSKIIIFAPTTKLTQMIAQVVRDARLDTPAARGTEVYEIHSKRDQRARFNTSDRFRQDKSGASILVTSDVSARGVDYPGTTRVIQVGVPSSKDQYIHRIGRTGRAGASGRSDIVLLNWERGFLHFQLDDLPVKELPCDSLVEEVQTLCERFDESPDQFAIPTNMPATARGRSKDKNARRDGYERSFERNRAPGPVSLQGPLTDKYLTLTQAPLIRQSLDKMEPEVARETFSSLLGFYIGRANELRASKNSILEGLKTWAVEAAGMERPPYTSDMFLKKLGFSGSHQSGGDRYGGGGGFPRRNSASGGGFQRRDSASGGGFQRRDSASGGGFQRRDSVSGGGFQRRDSVSGGGFHRRDSGGSGKGGFARRDRSDGDSPYGRGRFNRDGEGGGRSYGGREGNLSRSFGGRERRDGGSSSDKW